MTVAVAFNRPSPGLPDSEDVLREVEFVEAALAASGHRAMRIEAEPGLGGLEAMLRGLRAGSADAVFNLIESPAELPRLHPAAAAIFEFARIPFTGSPYDALLLTTDKAACKAFMEASGIPTPPWALYPGTDAAGIWHEVADGGTCIAKPLMEDASVGIEDSSVFLDPDSLKRGLGRMHEKHGRLLVERFAPGREYNVSVIEGEDGMPRCLPVAEMTFRDWPEGKPRIVNYPAKWDPGSFEYNNTVREFGVDPLEAGGVEALALRCWDAFGLRGYARVDMRMDENGKPTVMEINANPCISPDSGFVAAALKGGLTPEALVGGIMDCAMRRGEAR